MNKFFTPHAIGSAVLCVLCVSLWGCAVNGGTGLPIHNGNYAPDVNLKGDQRRIYEQDLEVCQKQILTQYGNQYTGNNAITDLRLCLIKKGYVLLS